MEAMNSDKDELKAKPIFRWAGGKSWLIKYLPEILPEYYGNYHEPFLGGGSVFFYLQPAGNSYLSDINPDLIEAYCELRDNLDSVVNVLRLFKNTKLEFYRIRKTKFQTSIERTARFIYLNRTCFNGLYRVNKNGEFNVPYGYKKTKELFDVDVLRIAAQKLKNAHLTQADFECSLKNIKKHDLVYVDPPYTVSHIENGFIHYNERLFSMDDQRRLSLYIKEIHKRGAYYILSSAAHEITVELFGNISFPIRVSRQSTIGGRGSHRGTIEEYIFTNIKSNSEE